MALITVIFTLKKIEYGRLQQTMWKLFVAGENVMAHPFTYNKLFHFWVGITLFNTAENDLSMILFFAPCELSIWPIV